MGRSQISETLRHASFGGGGGMMADLTTISTAKGVAVTAVAEIDEGRRKGLKSRFPKANLYADWRDARQRSRKH